MLGKVASFMEEYHMAEAGDRILAAVSGGADSLCLLMALQSLQAERGYGLCAVHVEHGIRGAESQRDADFVEDYCQRQGVPCKIYHCQAASYAKEHKMTVEEGARQLRYGFFRQAAEEFGANKIAVAHSQNDCAETMLFRLARGTGLRGLQGILPIREDMGASLAVFGEGDVSQPVKEDTGEAKRFIIRPLLCLGRKEIERFLQEMGQPFCHDSTNRETEYDRNKIRLQAIPVLEEVNSQAVAHMAQASRAVAEALELVEDLVQEAGRKYVRERGGALYISQEILLERKLVRTSLFHKALAEVAGRSQDLSEAHVRQAEGLLEKQVGKSVSLPYGMEAERTYEGVLLRKAIQPLHGRVNLGMQDVPDGGCGPGREGGGRDPQAAGMPDIPGWTLPSEGVLEIPAFGYRICTKIIENLPEFVEIPKKMYTKWLDYDKIKGIMQLRTRQSKDFLVITADGKHKKLKNYLIDEKIPRQERDKILLLAEGRHILWAIGWRISEDVKVTEHTKRILEIEVQREGSGRNAFKDAF